MKKNLTELTLTVAVIGAFTAIPLVAVAGHTNTLLSAELDGREQVPAANDVSNRRIVGDPNGRGEAYVFGVDNDPLTLCYIVEVNRVALVPVGQGMMAHIHEGKRGSNGPVVANLAGPEDGNAADCLTEGEPGKFPSSEVGIVQRILGNPQDFYINVHNPDYPSGAVRGQLEFTLADHHDEHDAKGNRGNGRNKNR